MPGADETLSTADSNTLTTQCSDSTSATSDLNGDRRGTSARRSSSSCAEDRNPRVRGADNVCVAVNPPRANGAAGTPTGLPPGVSRESPGVCNDLKNVLFLAERDSDHWDSGSCSEDDESSGLSGSDSELSDSLAQEDPDGDTGGSLSVIITEKLRQLASSSHIVAKTDRDADAVQSSPAVECIDASAVSFSPEGEELMPRDVTCEEDSVEVAVVHFGDDEVTEVGIADMSDVGNAAESTVQWMNPSAINVAQDGNIGLPCADASEPDSLEVAESGDDKAGDIVDASASDAEPAGGEMLNLELEMYESSASIAIEEDGEEPVPSGACEENFVQFIGSERAKSVNRNDSSGLRHAASYSEELTRKCRLSADRDESADGTELYNADKSVVRSSLWENVGVAVGAESGTHPDLRRFSSSLLGSLPSNYVKQRALECDRLFSANAGPDSDAPPTESSATFLPEADSVESDLSNLPAFSDGPESNMPENTPVQVVVTAPAEEDLSSAYYSDTELDAEEVDSEGVPQRRDSFGSTEGELWPERNHVFRLARQYSGRVKAMNTSTTTESLRRQFLTSRQKSAEESSSSNELASSWAESAFLPTTEDEDAAIMPPAEFAPPSSPWTRQEMVSRWNDKRGRVKSVDETATFPQTNVRDTIRKLKEKVSAGSVTPHQSEHVSESFHPPSSSTEDDPEQAAGVNTSQKLLRQPGSLVQERMRMLHGGGSCS